ncbi:MAG: hypothetical protein BZY75_02470 [SAR202 cluster bacterium Io17-Chloro-G7]|nr:MAG: hypothetical protein BZY75_02470 [SAR202 cluster bacterium Io17-Chloro-G7]
MVKLLVKGIFGRLLSYAAFSLGFWLLYQGFSRPNVAMAVVGGAVVLLATYLMVQARKSDFSYASPIDDRKPLDSPIVDNNPSTSEEVDRKSLD